MVAYPTTWFCHKFHLLLDKWWEPARKKLLIHTFPFDSQHFHKVYQVLFSLAGLIVFRDPNLQYVVIFNPINLEKVTISFSGELGRKKIYGVFFHPSLGDYYSLWEISHDATSSQPKTIQYKILSLGASPSMRTICNPFAHRVKKTDSHTLFIGKYLYWMIECEENLDYKSGRNDIMQFDIIREEFSVKPCLVPIDTMCCSNQTSILNINGALSFVVMFPNKITIWRLEDHAEQLWTPANYAFGIENIVNTPKPFAVVDGNLALVSDRRLFVYNLMQGTVKSFRRKKYDCSAVFLSHQGSLASLKNCQSTIHVDEKGEVRSMRDI